MPDDLQSSKTSEQIANLRDVTNSFFKNREIKHGIMLVASPDKFGLLAKGVLNDPVFGLSGLDVGSLIRKTK